MRFHLLLIACFVFLSIGQITRGVEPSRRNVIRDENAKSGSLDWQLTRVRTDQNNIRSPWIEGYCSKQSVLAGDAIDIMVSTDPPVNFQIEIFRTGYYGGRGARLMTKLGPLPGKPQPIPAAGRSLRPSSITGRC